MSPHYPAVAERALHRCEYCHAPEAVFNLTFEVEHVVPLSLGGDDGEMNLALACRACNVHKAAHVSFLDSQTDGSVGLFDPRRDRWQAHFRADAETAAIVGLTPVGRATVDCLRMNSSVQVLARRQWMQLGLFP